MHLLCSRGSLGLIVELLSAKRLHLCRRGLIPAALNPAVCPEVCSSMDPSEGEGESFDQGMSRKRDWCWTRDWSMERNTKFRREDSSTDQPLKQERPESPVPSCVSMKSDWSMEEPENFRKESAENAAQERSARETKEMDRAREEREESYSTEQREMLQSHKCNLQRKFQCLFEEISRQGNPTLLNEIYTELYITEGGRGEVSEEHEVRQIEMASKSSEPHGIPIKYNDIFKPLHGQNKAIRTVLTKGVAGIGKTVSVQKFILDWTEEKANQDVHFIFPLPFRELNMIKEKKLCLMELLKHFFSDIKDFSIFSADKFKLLFIFDGLDECRIPLDFQSNPRCYDATAPTTLSALLTNLIKGNLLPSALLWITCRPAAADQIPPDCVDQVTEVRGFNDPQKEEYFRKRISDENLANRTITHLMSSRSLFIMCYIPVFCWISAAVLERMLRETERGEMPRTLTQMYTHFLIIQTHIKQKYTERKETDEEVIFKLGKLAFQQLEKGNLIFYEEDLTECGIDVTEASVYSGVCTQIFREESGLHQEKVFCFVHLSIQEFLAALYVHLIFITRKENVLNPVTSRSQLTQIFRPVSDSLCSLHKSAVDLALESKNGHLDLFLRFLLGLSVESNQKVLTYLLPLNSQSQNTEETVWYIRQKIRAEKSERRVNLFHCLIELNDQSLMKEIQIYLSSGDLKAAKLSPLQWSAVAFLLQELDDEVDLEKFSQSGEHLVKVMPVVMASRAVVLYKHKLMEQSCSSQAAILSSDSSPRQLDWSNSEQPHSGMEDLCALLRNPLCKLERLELSNCNLSEHSCSSLASALSSCSSLRELNLSGNKLLDSGVERLSDALKQSLELEKLQLCYCKLTEKSCSYLASVLRSASSLRQLDLSRNKLQDSGVELLADALQDKRCQLEKLQLCSCKLTAESCRSLAKVLSSGSRLTQLNLSFSDLSDSGDSVDSGVECLSAALKSLPCKPDTSDAVPCKLEILELRYCKLSEQSCSSLASALSSGSSLRQLDLRGNNVKDSGVEHFSAALGNPLCQLETLVLYNCNLTEKSCSLLASALSSDSTLKHLDLSYNDVLDSGVKILCTKLNPQCKLETLELWSCKLSEQSCSSLASAISSGSSLRQLDLSENNLKDLGVEHLTAVALSNPNCKLVKLELWGCNLTGKSCSCLASALSSDSSLRQLDLRGNGLQDSDIEPLLALQSPEWGLEDLQWRGYP